jgi:hypothetical protein
MLLRCFGKNERASERTSEGEGESGGERKCQSQLQVKGDDRWAWWASQSSAASDVVCDGAFSSKGLENGRDLVGSYGQATGQKLLSRLTMQQKERAENSKQERVQDKQDE